MGIRSFFRRLFKKSKPVKVATEQPDDPYMTSREFDGRQFDNRGRRQLRMFQKEENTDENRVREGCLPLSVEYRREIWEEIAPKKGVRFNPRAEQRSWGGTTTVVVEKSQVQLNKLQTRRKPLPQ